MLQSMLYGIHRKETSTARGCFVYYVFDTNFVYWLGYTIIFSKLDIPLFKTTHRSLRTLFDLDS